MDRRLCLLCVSKFSDVSQSLIERLTRPRDLLAVSGTTVVDLDSPQDRAMFVEEFGIATIPTLIVWYRGRPPQAFTTTDMIVYWYDELFSEFRDADPTKSEDAVY